jgi:bifunctional non-homologous end joining protein LigD
VAEFAFVEPMLATATRSVPAAEQEWAAEIKWDGARAIAYVRNGTVLLRGRTGRDITPAFPEVAAGLAAVAGRRSLIIDGEITAFSGSLPNFALLQRRLHVPRPSPALVLSVPVTFVAFDLLHRAGRSLLDNPYGQRRALLDDLAAGGDTGAALMIPPAFPGESRTVLDVSRELGLEGVLLKRITSRYRPGQRSPEWLKIRHLSTVDVVIGGWVPGTGWRLALAGSVLAGRPVPAGGSSVPEVSPVSGAGALEYVGLVGSGFAEAELRDLTERLRALEVPSSPFIGSGSRSDAGSASGSASGAGAGSASGAGAGAGRVTVPESVARRARWTRPVLAAEVAYTEFTPSGVMRHPVWRGLRPA